MSFSETIFLFFLALVIFGPKKLPEIARQVGKVLNEFRRASNEFKAQIEQEISHIELEERRRTILPPSPPVEGTASRTLNGASSEASTASSTPAEITAPPEPAASAPVVEDEPLFATGPAAVAPEPNPLHPESAAVTSANSQESHA
jgi:sec-independent protein translocase protein TatB